MKCDKCINCCVPVMSENGMHYNCCLHTIAQRNCLLGKKDHFEEMVTNITETDNYHFGTTWSYMIVDEMKEGEYSF